MLTPSNDSETNVIEFEDTAGGLTNSSVKSKALEKTQIKMDVDNKQGLCNDITFSSIIIY